MNEREELIDLLATSLAEDVYSCLKAWEAWDCGTMSQDDFIPASEDIPLLWGVADALIAAGYRKEASK